MLCDVYKTLTVNGELLQVQNYDSSYREFFYR